MPTVTPIRYDQPIQTGIPTQATTRLEPQPPERQLDKQSTIGKETPSSTETTQIKEETKTPENLSQSHLSLARREKALRAKFKEFQSEKDSMKSKIESLEKQISDWSGLKQKAQSDPLDALASLGLDYDKLTQAQLSASPEAAELRKIKQELDAQKSSQASLLSKLQKQESESISQAKKQIRNEATYSIENMPEFELCKDEGDLAKDAAVDIIVKNHAETGVIMQMNEVLKEIEEYFEEELKRKLSLPKAKAILNPPEPVQDLKQLQNKQQPLNTLSNRHAPSTAGKFKSWEEKRAEAILRMTGQL